MRLKMSTATNNRAIFTVIFTAAILIILVMLSRALGLYYLGEAKKSDGNLKKLRSSEYAVLFLGDAESHEVAGGAALAVSDYQLAERYLTKCHTVRCSILMAKTSYAQNKYATGLAAISKINLEELDELKLSGHLGVGDIEKASNILKKSSNSKFDTVRVHLLLAPLLPGQLSVDDTRDNSLVEEPMKYRNSYLYMKSRAYPQAALSLLKRGYAANSLDRDSLFVLAEAQITSSDYSGARDTLQRLIAIDPYYPQAYRQLVQVSDKLGDKNSSQIYKKRLEQLTW